MFRKRIVKDAKFIKKKTISWYPDAIELFNYSGEILGLALANSVADTSPETIFLFGGLALGGDFFLYLSLKVSKNICQPFIKIKILPSQLTENKAAKLGAEWLIWKEMC